MRGVLGLVKAKEQMRFSAAKRSWISSGRTGFRLTKKRFTVVVLGFWSELKPSCQMLLIATVK